MPELHEEIMNVEFCINEALEAEFGLVNEITTGGGNVGIATRSSLGVVMVGDNLNITSKGVLSVDMADSIEEDNTRPVSAAKVYTEIGNINALLATI